MSCLTSSSQVFTSMTSTIPNFKKVYDNSLVIIKDQQKLTPTNHFNFTHRFDPKAPAVHGHGTLDKVEEARKDGDKSLIALG
ncbi:hypothetical protein AC578_845 [Pseudocercospora eumusae]|uniref:Uncharacterized protein n=1 Tax=Pseudocercospora eumusae TaxID=321146 RepID=A0A139H443_9PEZI|nr:hypothetical protein AC578_845 [Pseudocercospora eumusae]